MNTSAGLIALLSATNVHETVLVRPGPRFVFVYRAEVIDKYTSGVTKLQLVKVSGVCTNEVIDIYHEQPEASTQSQRATF